MARLVLVDDDQAIRDSYVSLLEMADHSAISFASAEAFLAEADLTAIDCLIVDFQLDGMSGADLIRRLREHGHRIPVILLSGIGREALAEVRTLGDIQLLQKPCLAKTLFEAVETAAKVGKQTDVDPPSGPEVEDPDASR